MENSIYYAHQSIKTHNNVFWINKLPYYFLDNDE